MSGLLTVQILIQSIKIWTVRRIELKVVILQEWEALPQAVINNAIDGFRSRVRLVIAENGQI